MVETPYRPAAVHQAWGEPGRPSSARGGGTHAGEVPPVQPAPPASARGSTRYATQEAPMETLPGKALESHREHRITVPMPRSLDELRAVAQRKGFKNGRALYHNGRHHLSHNNHVRGIPSDDVVVVACDEAPEEAAPTTTNKEHFVQHAYARREQCRPDQNLGEPGKWYGETRYGTDFINHGGGQKRIPVRPVDGLKRGQGPTGKSSYRAAFPWLDVTQLERITNHEVHSARRPFEGVSSYRADFPAHPDAARPRSLLAPRERPPVGGGTFYGTSTYGAHFEDHKLGTPQPIPPQPPALKLGAEPFDGGGTEYSARFLKHPHERPAVLHLEPQRRSPQPV